MTSIQIGQVVLPRLPAIHQMCETVSMAETSKAMKKCEGAKAAYSSWNGTCSTEALRLAAT